MPMHPTPTREGFYWAKWKFATPGTDTCLHCGKPNSEWETESPISLTDWEPVEVFENCGDARKGDLFRVQVGGVNKSQSIEDFVWGPEIEAYKS